MNTPIVLILDDNYFIPTATCITSILHNKYTHTTYQFIILSNNLNNENKKKLESIINSNNACSVKFIEVDKTKYAKYKCGWDPAVFLIYEIIPLLLEYDQCLYLDGDIICLTDLSNILQIDLGDNYAGVVRNAQTSVLDPNRKWLYENPQDYVGKQFNSGFILFNLKILREKNGYDQLINASEYFHHNQINQKSAYWGDQDALNRVFLGKCTFFPVSYNYTFSTNTSIKNGTYTQEELNLAEKSPHIIHYTTKFKPWTYYFAFLYYPREKIKFYKLWMHYFKLINPPIELPKRKFGKIFSKKIVRSIIFIILHKIKKSH